MLKAYVIAVELLCVVPLIPVAILSSILALAYSGRELFVLAMLLRLSAEVSPEGNYRMSLFGYLRSGEEIVQRLQLQHSASYEDPDVIRYIATEIRALL